MGKEKDLPSVILTERAAQVFKDSCKSEGTTLQETFCESVLGQVDVQVGNMS